MSIEQISDARPFYYISDVHLGASAGIPGREERLLDLLREVAGLSGALFILGDLFDFWFEYRHVVPKGTFRIARALATVREAGIPVIYLGGNHDFWVGDYLVRELGLRVFQEPVTMRLNGRTVHLAHGDGLGPGDTGYKILKKVLRSRPAIACYRAIHPDVGIPFAYRFSAVSRKHTEAREVLLPKILRDVARPRIQGEVSAMLMGHVHYPAHYQGGNRDFLIIGDWMDSLTHVRQNGDRFTLYRLEGDRHVPIPPEPFPDGFWGR